MPIVKALLVSTDHQRVPDGAAQSIANAVAQVLGQAPGRVWVTLQQVSAGAYAENGTAEPPCPVFIEVLHADLPTPEELAAEARALTEAVARSRGRPPDLVHVEYAAPGRGRVAFGGHLLT